MELNTILWNWQQRKTFESDLILNHDISLGELEKLGKYALVRIRISKSCVSYINSTNDKKDFQKKKNY